MVPVPDANRIREQALGDRAPQAGLLGLGSLAAEIGKQARDNKFRRIDSIIRQMEEYMIYVSIAVWWLFAGVVVALAFGLLARMEN